MDPMTISSYRFKMLERTGLKREGDTFTYTGLCDLDQEFLSQETVTRFAYPRAIRIVSWTLPAILPTPPPPPPAPAVPPPAAPPAGATSGPSSLRKRKRVVDDEEAVRAEDVAGPSQRCPMWDDLGNSSEGSDYVLRFSARAPEEEEEEPMEEESCDCIEVIDIESSVEIIDLVSDSEPEEDPSEASSGRCSGI